MALVVDKGVAAAPPRTLADLAQIARAELRGNGSVRIHGVCTLEKGRRGCIAFLANSLYAKHLASTAASAVIVAPGHAGQCRVPALIAEDPYAAYARVAKLFEQRVRPPQGIHPKAVVDDDAEVDPGASVAAGAVIGAGTVIGPGVVVGAGAVVGRGCRVGMDSEVGANATLGDGVTMGARVIVHPGAVLGSRGFGLARDGEGWIDVPQLGSVVVGDDVEIGANTTVDRGALEDTVIEEGVKLDNQIQVGHNVRIGAHTAIAGCTGIAGSTTIGRRCMIGGHVGINGHISIGDDVVVMGMTMVTKSLPSQGMYASGLPVEPAGRWRRLVARVRRLQQLEDKVRKLSQPGQRDGDKS